MLAWIYMFSPFPKVHLLILMHFISTHILDTFKEPFLMLPRNREGTHANCKFPVVISHSYSFKKLNIIQKVRNSSWWRLYLMTCLTVMLVLYSIAWLIIYHCFLIFTLIHSHKRLFFWIIWKILSKIDE